eukprot:scaffold45170_cov32-Tisochrysis_lutea.AAC.5
MNNRALDTIHVSHEPASVEILGIVLEHGEEGKLLRGTRPFISTHNSVAELAMQVVWRQLAHNATAGFNATYLSNVRTPHSGPCLPRKCLDFNVRRLALDNDELRTANAVHERLSGQAKRNLEQWRADELIDEYRCDHKRVDIVSHIEWKRGFVEDLLCKTESNACLCNIVHPAHMLHPHAWSWAVG